jgi:undecaprenyl-diphosphatase
MSHGVYHMNFAQATVIWLLQGISELFPVSSLGHTVLMPSWIGGTWATLVAQESQMESPYLAFVVGLHLATAVVLLGFYAREWARSWPGSSAPSGAGEWSPTRSAWPGSSWWPPSPSERSGSYSSTSSGSFLHKPVAAELFLMANGVILLAGEQHRRRQEARAGVIAVGHPPQATLDTRIVPMDDAAERELSRIGVASAAIIGASQVLAL